MNTKTEIFAVLIDSTSVSHGATICDKLLNKVFQTYDTDSPNTYEISQLVIDSIKTNHKAIAKINVLTLEEFIREFNFDFNSEDHYLTFVYGIKLL